MTDGAHSNVLSEIQDPKGGVLRLTYDSQKRLVEVRNQVGRTWRFTRDANGRVTREQDFDDLVIDYAYDKADRLIETRHVDGVRIEYAYDGAGLALREDVFEPTQFSPVATTNFAYDDRGLLASAANGWASVAFRRDGVGRVVSETQNGRMIESELDCCGRRVRRRIGERLTEAAYDPMGALAAFKLDGGPSLRFTRDAMGRETTRVSEKGFRLDQSYDRVGQLLRQTVVGVGPVVDRSYRWSKSYEPLSIADRRWGETSYAYDAAGQVTRALFGDGRGEAFDYDPALNVFAGGEIGAAQAWLSSAGGRVKAARGPFGEKIFLTHDARGRVIERRVERDGFRPRAWRYGWDGKDRLVSCRTPDGEDWSYGYDPFGRRVFKRREPLPGLSVRPGDRIGTAFFWDGDVVAQEAPLLAQRGADWADATHWHFEPNGFRPLARQDAGAGGEAAGRTLYVVNDHLGTPRELVDERGAAVWSAALSLWGATRSLWRPAVGRRTASLSAAALAEPGETLEGADLCPIRFQGQWEDEETGLYYNRFRHYDPLAAQYVSPDPIGLAGGGKSFSFVLAPTSYSDVFGLQQGPLLLPPPTPAPTGRLPGPTIWPPNGQEVGRFIVDPKGNGLVEPKGGTTSAAGRGGDSTHTYYKSGRVCCRLDGKGHGPNGSPHAHAHEDAPPTSLGNRRFPMQGDALDTSGRPVPYNSGPAHWPVK
jgi:RHS repeat-associated protein